MDPILIVAYPEKIAAHEAWLTNQITLFQAVYNKFKLLGITPTLDDINKLRANIYDSRHGITLNDYMTDKMLEKLDNPSFNGVPIKPTVLRDMIDIPDPNPIRVFIREYQLTGRPSFLQPGYYNLNPEYFEIVNDVVQKQATTDAAIEALYSHYTQNDKGVQTYDLITEWKNNVDTFNAKLTTLKATFKVDYVGIDNINGVLVPSLKLIRANEAK